MRPRVLYTDPPWLVDGSRINEALATVEADLLGDRAALVFGPFVDGRYRLTGREVLELARDARVVVVYRYQVTADLLDAAGKRLRAVIRQGVGVDNLNAALLADRGVLAFNVPDYCVDEVSSHTTALALALERGVVPQHLSLAGGRFDIYAGGTPRRTSRRTLGIVGFGRIGRAVARKLGPHYGRVAVYDPYLGHDLAEGYGCRPAETLEELLRGADLVSLHCPLTPQTRHLIDRHAIGLMREGAHLVNAARGALVDPVALGEALERGRLAGAALDVFSPENPHDDPAWAPVLRHPAVVVTSHRAFLSRDSEASSRRRVAELVRCLLDGETPLVGRVFGEGCHQW